MNNFQGKTAWVTGASSGIGEGIVRDLAEKGVKIILSARNLDALEKIKATLPNSDQHICISLDLEHSQNFPELANEVISKMGKIDFLFNNGGLSQRSEAGETPLEVDRRIMEINYFGNIALTKAVLPYMQKQKSGHIIVISSIAGKFGFFLRSAYSASKHALQGFYERCWKARPATFRRKVAGSIRTKNIFRLTPQIFSSSAAALLWGSTR